MSRAALAGSAIAAATDISAMRERIGLAMV
jgi:hypothetical protein